MLKKDGIWENTGFQHKIGFTWFEIWHHEGRRARMGAAMMGPDYTWWHGIYDVAHNFYFKFIPEARHYNDPEVNAYIDNLLKNDEMHNWVNKPTGEIKEAIRTGELQKVYQGLFDKN